jgi:hypothetical protein
MVNQPVKVLFSNPQKEMVAKRRQGDILTAGGRSITRTARNPLPRSRKPT